ncbi:MAG TPA: benzoylformate decarboxylase [Nitrososphaerales archaeon]|nr:benzoylformate decarboxylase [Nitrososphaerales archaeon]
MTSVRERIFQVFRAHGLSVIFGNPGSTELPFLENFHGDFSYILGLHEGSVVAMAIGYSFLSDKPAVVNLHTAAGTGNAMGSIVTAWHAQAPLIITAGQQDRRQIRTEPFLWGRQAEFVKPYVKWSVEPQRSIDVPEAIERAYHIAMSEPKGPVFVSIPMDGLEDECPSVEIRNVSYRTAPDEKAIEEIAKVLSQARKIALIAGEQVDASGSTADLVRLAELLKSHVFLPPIAHRWSFPSGHELFRGRLPPAMKAISDTLAPYDTVLAIGSSVFQYYPYIPGPFINDGTRVFQITNDPMMASRAVTGTSVVGDVSLGIRQLLSLVKQKEGTPPLHHKTHNVISSIPPTSEYVHQRLAEAIPSDAVIFDEAPTSERYERLNLIGSKSHFQTASGGLGFAMPAAVGAAIAQIERPVVCIVGDGSAQYSIQSLWSAANYNAAVTFIVLNNSEYAILKSFGMLFHEEGLPGLDVPDIDFEGLASGYGVEFKRVVDPDQITSTVQNAIQSRKSSLIEIPIDRHISPLL